MKGRMKGDLQDIAVNVRVQMYKFNASSVKEEHAACFYQRLSSQRLLGVIAFSWKRERFCDTAPSFQSRSKIIPPTSRHRAAETGTEICHICCYFPTPCQQGSRLAPESGNKRKIHRGQSIASCRPNGAAASWGRPTRLCEIASLSVTEREILRKLFSETQHLSTITSQREIRSRRPMIDGRKRIEGTIALVSNFFLKSCLLNYRTLPFLRATVAEKEEMTWAVARSVVAPRGGEGISYHSRLAPPLRGKSRRGGRAAARRRVYKRTQSRGFGVLGFARRSVSVSTRNKLSIAVDTLPAAQCITLRQDKLIPYRFRLAWVAVYKRRRSRLRSVHLVYPLGGVSVTKKLSEAVTKLPSAQMCNSTSPRSFRRCNSGQWRTDISHSLSYTPARAALLVQQQSLFNENDSIGRSSCGKTCTPIGDMRDNKSGKSAWLAVCSFLLFPAATCAHGATWVEDVDRRRGQREDGRRTAPKTTQRHSRRTPEPTRTQLAFSLVLALSSAQIATAAMGHHQGISEGVGKISCHGLPWERQDLNLFPQESTIRDEGGAPDVGGGRLQVRRRRRIGLDSVVRTQLQGQAAHGASQAQSLGRRAQAVKAASVAPRECDERRRSVVRLLPSTQVVPRKKERVRACQYTSQPVKANPQPPDYPPRSSTESHQWGGHARAMLTLLLAGSLHRAGPVTGPVTVLFALAHPIGISGQDGLNWDLDPGALPGQDHQRQRRSIPTATEEEVPGEADVEEIEVAAVFHSVVGSSSAQHIFHPMKVMVQESVVESTAGLLETALEHEYTELYPGLDMPPVGAWHEDADIPKRMASLLQRRDALARQKARYRAFQQSILATHTSILRPRNDGDDGAPPSKRHATNDTVHEREERQLEALYMGVKVITTVASLLQSTLNTRQVNRLHQNFAQIKNSAAATLTRLESMAGTVASLARSTHDFYTVMTRDNKRWDASLLWDELFEQFKATTEHHMEVIASAAANTLHPKIIPQIDVERVAQDLADLRLKNNLIPIIESPADYISLPTSLSLLRSNEDDNNYVGWQLITLIPMSTREAQLSLFRLHRVPVRVNDGRYILLTPADDIIIAVTTKSGTEKAHWTSITASGLAECRQNRRHYLCLSLGALRPPLLDDQAADGPDAATCAYALYAGLESLALATCQHHEVRESVMVTQLAAYQFAVYVSEPAEIHISCPARNDDIVPTETRRLQRLAVVHLPPGCVARVAGAVLHADDVVRAPTERIFRAHIDDQLDEAISVWKAKRRAAQRQDTVESLGNQSTSVFSAIANSARILSRMDSVEQADRRQDVAVSSQTKSTAALFTITGIITTLLVATLVLLLSRLRTASQAVLKFVGCRSMTDVHLFLRRFVGINYMIEHLYILDSVAEDHGRRIHRLRRELHALARAVFPRDADEFGPLPPPEYDPPCKFPPGQSIPALLDRAVMSEMQRRWGHEDKPSRKRRRSSDPDSALVDANLAEEAVGAEGDVGAAAGPAAEVGHSSTRPSAVGRRGRSRRE